MSKPSSTTRSIESKYCFKIFCWTFNAWTIEIIFFRILPNTIPWNLEA
jgi:hypothetical protein